jgi:hypothetical protein
VPNYFKYRPLFIGNDGYLSKESDERMISPISNGYYYLPNRAQLNDPTEGVFENRIYEGVSGFLQGVAALGEAQDLQRAIIEYMNQIDRTNDDSGVYSLTTAPADELMWAHYANSHHGIAVEYDLAKLIRFSAEIRTHSLPVTYSTSPPKIDLPLKGHDSKAIVMSMLGNKSSTWSHEREHRIVIENLSGQVPHDYRAVKSITFGARLPQSVREQVYESTRQRVLEYYEIVMPSNEYTLERKLIDSMVGSHPTGSECTIEWSEHLQAVPPDRVAEFKGIMENIIESDPHFKELMVAELVNTDGEYVLLMYEVNHEKEIEYPARFSRHRLAV